MFFQLGMVSNQLLNTENSWDVLIEKLNAAAGIDRLVSASLRPFHLEYVSSLRQAAAPSRGPLYL
jgi:hypothetical protein